MVQLLKFLTLQSILRGYAVPVHQLHQTIKVLVAMSVVSINCHLTFDITGCELEGRIRTSFAS